MQKPAGHFQYVRQARPDDTLHTYTQKQNPSERPGRLARANVCLWVMQDGGRGVRERAHTSRARGSLPPLELQREVQICNMRSQTIRTQNQLVFFTQQRGMSGRLISCWGCYRATGVRELMGWGRTVQVRWSSSWSVPCTSYGSACRKFNDLRYNLLR